MTRSQMGIIEDKLPGINETNWVEPIFSNLVQFYRCFENEEKVHYLQENGLEVIKSEYYGWPNFILGGDEGQQTNIDQVIKNIRERMYPPFWISLNRENQEQRYQKHGFLLVNRWAGMAMTLNAGLAPFNHPESLSIKKVLEPGQLEDWFSVTEPEVLRNHNLNIEQFRNLADKKELLLFVGYLGTTPVSSATLFFSKNDAGLYLVATKRTFRNKGYASAIIKHVLNAARLSGYQRLVLHANPKAVNIYSNLGFQKYCDLNIFWFP